MRKAVGLSVYIAATEVSARTVEVLATYRTYGYEVWREVAVIVDMAVVGGQIFGSGTI